MLIMGVIQQVFQAQCPLIYVTDKANCQKYSKKTGFNGSVF